MTGSSTATAGCTGIEELFVASGSVIPTGGFANPTLTIVALASRVGEYLQQALPKAARTGVAL